MALDPNQIKETLQKVMKAKKRNVKMFGTGEDFNMPSFYIKAPPPIKKLLGMDYPGGRIIEFSGRATTGKTTLGMEAIIQAQKGYFDENGTFVEDPINIILVDTEKKFNAVRFTKMGGDPKKMFKVDANTLEDAYFGLDETLTVIFSLDPNAKVLIVFDSYGKTPSKAEVNTNADEQTAMAVAAKVNNRNMRILVAKYFGEKDIMGIFINTCYKNLGSPGSTNSGGEGLEFAAGAIIQLSRIANITKKRGNDLLYVGIKTKASITKNHIQTADETLKEVTFEIHAGGVQEIGNYKLSKDAMFNNSKGSVVILKVGKKDKKDPKKDVEVVASVFGEEMTMSSSEMLEFLQENHFSSVEGKEETEDDME